MKNRLMSGALAAGLLLLNLSEAAVAAYDNTHQRNMDIYSDIVVDENVFADETFRNWILDKNNLNGIGEDGILSYDERLQIKSIDVSGKNISDLQGIEVFTNLEDLDCSRNTLSSLDLSGNTLLKTINCSNNQITELSLDNLQGLTSLSCNYNRLASLDVSNKSKLRALSCEYNYIEELDITGDTSLEWVNVRTNLLTELDTTDNVKIKVIEAFDNKLETLKTSTLSELEFINVASNKLTELDLSQNTNLSAAGGGFAASNNLLEKIILPDKPQLTVELSAFKEQDPILGYDRVKWFEDEDLSIELTDAVAAQGQSLYSKRIANDYRVYFSANGGSGVMQPQEAVYDEEFELSENAFTRTGYTFEGWNTLPKGNGTSYSNAESVQNLSGKSNGSRITLYAQWEPVGYTIRFDANSEDAEGSMEDQQAVYNTDLTLHECGFTVDGKEFAGWSHNPDEQVRYGQGASVKNLASSEGETAVLYAVWKTPAEELQKPYLTELEETFNSYSSSDYTAEDWDMISNVYYTTELLIRGEIDPENMSFYCESAAEEMALVMTKSQRVEEMAEKWEAKHNDVIQNLNAGILNEDNCDAEYSKAESALGEMTAKELEQYSTLLNPEDLERTAAEALQQINVHSEDLTAYASASKWISSLNNAAKRSLSEVRTDSLELYQALNTQYEQLTEKEKNHIAGDLKSRLQERLSLASQKNSAVTDLKSAYYSIDQSEYTEYSRELLANRLSEGIEKIENSASEETVLQELTNGKQNILNVSGDEEESHPGDEPSEDEDDEDNDSGDNNTGGGSGGGSGGTTYPVYRIEVPAAENGTVSSSVKMALKGTTVTLTVTPNEGYRIKSVKAVDVKNNEITLSKKETGVYTFTMPYSNVTVKAEFVKEYHDSFTDVDKDTWYYDAVCYVNDSGLFKGVSDDTFGTDMQMLRSMLMTVLYRAAGEPEVQEDDGFTDVEDGMWYTSPIKWAKQNGIASGEDNNTFAPHKSVTREQIVAMLYRFAKSPEYTEDLQGFSDADQVEEYARDAFKWAVGNGIINGMGDGTLNPKGEASRAQVAQMMMKFIEI